MDARELRIGNWIQVTSAEHWVGQVVSINIAEAKVDEYTTQSGYYVYITQVGQWTENFYPIPLTEEWLLKFGFAETYSDSGKLNVYEKVMTPEFGFIYSYYIEDLTESKYFKGFDFRQNVPTVIHPNDSVEKSLIPSSLRLANINFVHQLQNLYFALTGKELELK